MISHKPLLLYLLLCISCLSCSLDNGNELSRVQKAYQEKWPDIESLLQKKNIPIEKAQFFLRAFKQEKELELWGKNRNEDQFQLIKKYNFCTSSGIPGPKRKEGDRQIPEGFYHIDRLNPNSKFYLSLGINYPNEADKKLGDPKQPGSDIFIHGDCVSIGCIAITDDRIKELYTFIDQAFQFKNKQIPVHIFPAKLTAQNLQQLSTNYPKHKYFWKILQQSFEYFEAHQQILNFTVGKNGNYEFTEISN